MPLPTERTLDQRAVAGAARLLAEHRRSGRLLAALPEPVRPVTLTDGYAIQDELVQLLVAEHGGQRIGYKVACTNALAQAALGVDGPMFGQLLASSTTTSPAVLDADRFTTRVIECEFGVRIGSDVPVAAGGHTAATIAAFVADLLPAIEVVDHRFHDWSLGAAAIAADNAIHGWWVHGRPYAGEWRELDLAHHEVEARIDGEVVGRGTGGAVLGHPLNVVAWLADELARQGRTLRAGELVTTGVCTDVFQAAAGSTVEGDFGVLGSVSLRWR